MIELLPGTVSQEIQILLHHRELSDIPTYEALSYEWGEPVRQYVLYCEGSVLKCTSNLLAALKRLRLPDKSRWLWVDANCINQDLCECKLCFDVDWGGCTSYKCFI